MVREGARSGKVSHTSVDSPGKSVPATASPPSSEFLGAPRPRFRSEPLDNEQIY